VALGTRCLNASLGWGRGGDPREAEVRIAMERNLVWFAIATDS
jgi:hypothetical protein